MALNPDKTEIRELPCELETQWLYPLRQFEFRTSVETQATDLIAYFERAFEFSRTHSRDPVLKYAIARLRGIQIEPANWPLAQHLVLQCLSVEPGAFYQVLGILTDYQLAGQPIERALVEEVMNAIILKQSTLGHGSEVAWALWAAMMFGLRIDHQARVNLERMEDSIVALLALDAASRGLVAGILDTATWQSYMDQSELYGDHWLLSYEANVQGWLPSTGPGDHVAADRNFGFLKAQGVHFYDRARAAAPMASTAVAPSHGTAPLFVFPPEEYA